VRESSRLDATTESTSERNLRFLAAVKRPRLSRWRWLYPALAVLLLAAFGSSSARDLASPIQGLNKQATQVPSCSRVPLVPQLGWTESAAWTPDGNELIALDTLYNRALRYSKGGRALGALPTAVEQLLERRFPLRIRRMDSSFVVEVANARFMRLNDDYQPVGSMDLPKSSLRSDGWRATYLFQWVIAGSDLLGYGDYEHRSEEGVVQRTGVLRVPLDEPENFKVLDVPLSAKDDTTRTLYRLGYPYFTSLGSDGVILAMYENPQIFIHKVEDDDLVPIDAMPEAVRRRDPLEQKFETPSDFPLVMKEVEGATMPAGIFGWKGLLYLLYRQPGDLATVWSLAQIDPGPENARVLGTVTLPTSANHLTVVPGDRNWAFLEKGPVQAFGKQKIDSVLFVASDRVASLSSDTPLCPKLRARMGG